MPKLPAGIEQDGTVPMAALTDVQYGCMERWSNGTFEADWEDREPVPTALEEIPVQDRPLALDRAALDACVGGGFFPGIEVGQIMLEESTYDKERPFRINAHLLPGTLTAQMAVPWQADFIDCHFESDMDWWPGQRPNEVWRQKTADEWVRAAWVPAKWGPERMVNEWSKLGFIVKDTSTDRCVERDRFL
jgi:hypothetical protein